jgi:hypothetical protein
MNQLEIGKDMRVELQIPPSLSFKNYTIRTLISCTMRLIAVFIFGLLISCDPIDDKLTIRNSTTQRIYYMKSSYGDLGKMYDETVELQGKNLNYQNFINDVDPGSSKQLLITGGGEAWKRYIEKACEDGKLRVYTFSIDTLKKYTWEEVMKGNRYLNRIEVSVYDLEKVGWNIEYKE